MSEIIERLRDRRANVWEQAKTLADAAAEENRAFSGEEEGQWQSLNAELDALDKRIKATLDGETRAKEAEDAFNKLEGRSQDRPDGKTSQGESELRAFLRGDPGAPRAFEVVPDGPVNFRDLLKGTATAGGDTVPRSFYNRLVTHLIEVSGVMQTGPTVLNTGSGENIQIPKTTAHSTGGIIAEAGAITESDPAFGQITLGSFKYARMIQLSRELVEDTGVDLEGYLAMQAGRAVGNAFGAHMVTGTGSGQPRGVVTDASEGLVGPVGTATTFGNQATAGQGFDLLISLYHSVISPYRASGSTAWLMNDTTASLVRRIKSTDGVYAWQPSLTAGDPDLILGKPAYIDPNVASPAANAKSILFGDFSQYFVRTVNGVRFERSDDFAFGNDLVSYRVILRADAALVDLTGAVKYFAHSAT